MSEKPGEVMGLFAFGHPFLDGNGRTMLLVHIDLARRAGYSIAWERVAKADYLKALSAELELPGRGALDEYLRQFKQAPLDKPKLDSTLLAVKGLDGLDEGNQIDGELSDPAVAKRYQQFDQRRRYRYEETNRGALAGASPEVGNEIDSQEKVVEATPVSSGSSKKPNGKS